MTDTLDLTSSLDSRLESLSYADLSEAQPEGTKTTLERGGLTQELSKNQEKFLRDGYVIIEDFLPSRLIEHYCRVRETLPKDLNAKDNYWGGWHYPTPFMDHEELRDVACSSALSSLLRSLVGEPMGLNLALTGWVSTQRNWHSDQYLNPRGLWSKYLAVWFALDDIHEGAGPFEMVPGSHLWPVLTQEKLFSRLTEEEKRSPHWPTFTQSHIARVCENEFADRGSVVEKFTPRKGSILIWHSNLIHRGSVPKHEGLLRKSLICHYSSVPTRRMLDMPKVLTHQGQGSYFDLPTTGSVKP